MRGMSCREEKDQRKKVGEGRRKGVRGRRKRRGRKEKEDNYITLKMIVGLFVYQLSFFPIFPKDSSRSS